MAIIKNTSRLCQGNRHASLINSKNLASRKRHRSTRRITTYVHSEPADKGVEICQVGDDKCALPYELFQLPDLKKILSLETWNSCLSEKEREKLCAYLPNLDEVSYRETLSSLLAGDNFHFGCPLKQLFDLLKGGLCNPQVMRYREGFKYLQRKSHYHRVRNYQNNMVNSFLEMQNLWQHYPQLDFKERLVLWKKWKCWFSKLSPKYSEKKTSPSKKAGSQMLSLRNLKLLNSKGIIEAQCHTLHRVAEPKADFKTVLDMSLSSFDSKGDNDGSLDILKTQKKSKSNSKRLVNMTTMQKDAKVPEVDRSELCLVMQDDNVTSLRVDHLANIKLLREKPEKLQNEVETDERKKGMTKISEEELLVELSLGEDDMLTDTKVEEETQAVGVQMHEKSMAFQEGQKNSKPAKICERKIKAKINVVQDRIGEEGEKGKAFVDIPDQGGVSIEVEGTKLIVENDIEPGLEDDVAINKLGKKHVKKKREGEEHGNVPPTFSLDGVVERSALTKASKRQVPLSMPDVISSFPFSIIHVLSAVRAAMVLSVDRKCSDTIVSGEESGVRGTTNGRAFLVSPEVHDFEMNELQCESRVDARGYDEEEKGLSSLPFLEIVRRVRENPGDMRVLQMQEPLKGLVRGVLKVLSSKTTPPGVKGWKPFVVYDSANRAWTWIGPLQPSPCSDNTKEIQISAEAWGVSEKIIITIQELFANWLRQAQDTLQQRWKLSLRPPPPMLVSVNEKERFRELRAQKSLITITPTSEAMKSYFHKEETFRYSLTDRAFTYTRADGQKSVVAPLRRVGAKPNSKARDHFMLKPDRPPHVTILCLVRDAAARLPGSIGTRADVCALIRDSQYIVEDVSDAQINQVVSGALDRLHYERDPCVRFDGDRKLWVYLHSERDEEDFEDDGTSSTKRWKKSKKEEAENENTDVQNAQGYGYFGMQDQDPCRIGLDFSSSSSCFGGPTDLSMYPSGSLDLVYNNHAGGALVSPNTRGNGFPGQVREEGILDFIDLPPSIQPPCVNMQQSHPMGWEVLGNTWNQDRSFHTHNGCTQEDYKSVLPAPSVHRDAAPNFNGL